MTIYFLLSLVCSFIVKLKLNVAIWLYGDIVETLRVQVEKEKARKVREHAMRVYGHSKGSISKAVNKALDDWLWKFDAKRRKLTVDDIAGIASKIKMSSREAQKEGVSLMGKVD